MTSEYVVLWVDDDESRRSGERRNLGNDDRLRVEPVKPLDLASSILSDGDPIIEDVDPDLALVDWYLQTGEFSGDGPSIEGILHDRFPEMPVYAFSSQYGDQEFNRESKQGEHRFEIITAPHRLHDDEIIEDINDYRQIESEKGQGLDGILELLGADSTHKQKIQSTLPQEFANGIPGGESYDPGGILRFSRWVRQELLKKPGLLWDEIWTATKLGIDQDAFSEYTSEFTSSAYSGVFSHSSSRWWRTEITDRVYELGKERDIDVSQTWRDAPKILDVDPDDYATCVVCAEKYPETVAAGSPDEDPTLPVHYRCSNIENSRGTTFEDIRVLVEE